MEVVLVGKRRPCPWVDPTATGCPTVTVHVDGGGYVIPTGGGPRYPLTKLPAQYLAHLR